MNCATQTKASHERRQQYLLLHRLAAAVDDAADNARAEAQSELGDLTPELHAP
jgi:hypothetical protein